MNNYGEIKKLVEIVKPDISIITNIGNAHIGNFKNSQEIAKEKSDIFEYFSKKSIAIIPGDSKHTNLIKKKALRKTKNVFTFGRNQKCNSTLKIDKKDKVLFTTLKKQDSSS